ncbi:MAG: ribosomal protein S18-alanine N-acetyltransferase [Actinomycetota bacterium]
MNPRPRHRTPVRFELREMRRTDLADVAALESTVNPAPWSYQLFEGELSLPPSSRQWLVILADDRVVAFGGMMYAASTAHLMNLGVSPTLRRRGVAKALCVTLFAEARRRGAADLTLEVRVSNTGAAALYEHLGMTSVGTRPGYYGDGEDALIFWIDDLQAAAVGQHFEELAAA